MSIFQYVNRAIQLSNKKKRLQIINSAKEPLVSIILPAYNSENTIDGAVLSVIKQSYSSWELLIIDDGSSDGSIQKIQEVFKGDSRIRIYKNSINMGVAYSRNVGLLHARGEFITFHDADDVSHEERLEYQVSELIKRPSKKLVIFKCVRVNKEKQEYIINGKLRWNRVSGMMFGNELINKIGFFKQTHISEDSEYHERILAVFGKKSRKIINKVLYYALFNPDSLLFSNANVNVNGNRVDYKIKDKEAKVLKTFREEHKRIKRGEISPYQAFQQDNKITSTYTL